MADAKIINYGQQISAGSTAVPDNNATALDIESTDGKDYIIVDTRDGHETINIGSGADSSDVCHVSVGSAPGTIGEILRVRQNHTSDSLVLFENTGSGTTLDLQSNRSSGDVVTLKNNSGSIFASFDADHALKLINPTHENTDGGRESTVRFSGEKADGTVHDLARIESRHDGSSDDTKGEFVISTNNGSGLQENLVVNSTAAQINGQTIIKVADTNVTPDAGCDDFIIEGTGGTGMSIVTPNNVSGCYAFRSEASGGGDTTDKHVAIMQGKRDASNNNTVLHRLLDHPNDANSYFAFEASGVHRLKIDGAGSAIFNADVSTIGKLTTALTDSGGTASVSTSGSSTTLTGVNTTFLTDFHVGAAIKVGTVTTTVTAIASATSLTLEDAINTSSTGVTCTRDGGELFAVKTGDSKSVLSVNATGVLGLSTEPDAGTASSGNNLGIGDPNMFDAVTTMNRMTVIGNCRSNNAYSFVTGDSCVIIGFEAGHNSTAAQNSVLIGSQCADGGANIDQAVVIGQGAGTSIGDDGVIIGFAAGAGCTGSKNVAIGREALDASGTASNCVAAGYQALTAATANGNIGIGYRAGNAITTGYSNVLIGSDADGVADKINQIAIGQDAVTGDSNKVRLGNTSITNIDGEVAFNATSDARTKTNVEDLALGLDFINALRPVSFTRVHPAEYPAEILDKRYKQGREVEDEDGNKSFESTESFDVETNQPIKDEFDEATRSDGLIAQEVQAACDSIGAQFNGINETNQGKLGIQYGLLVAPLIKAVQELTSQNESLAARIATLEAGD